MPKQKFMGQMNNMPAGWGLKNELQSPFQKQIKMKKYLGVKIIEAEFASAGSCGCKEGGACGRCDKDGYKVVYEDGYTSWSPKDVFEKAYRRIDNLTFGLAVEALKLGNKVTRSDWNGKGMWLSYVDPYNNKQFDLIEKPEAEGTFAPYIGMKTADNAYVPWLASQTDVLAEDWMILED